VTSGGGGTLPDERRRVRLTSRRGLSRPIRPDTTPQSEPLRPGRFPLLLAFQETGIHTIENLLPGTGISFPSCIGTSFSWHAEAFFGPCPTRPVPCKVDSRFRWRDVDQSVVDADQADIPELFARRKIDEGGVTVADAVDARLLGIDRKATVGDLRDPWVWARFVVTDGKTADVAAGYSRTISGSTGITPSITHGEATGPWTSIAAQAK
jgi:hypothetical protein